MENASQQLQSTQPPTEDQPTLNHLSNKKGSLLIPIAIVFMVLVVGVGAYFFGIKRNQSSSQYSQQASTPSTTPSTSVSPSPLSDETATWQTYTDEKLKLSIKYPNDIVIIRSFADAEGGVVFARAKESKEDFRSITTLDIYLRGEVGTTPEQALKSECPTRVGEGCQEKFEAVTINNAVGIRTLGPNYPNENNYYLTSQSGNSKVVRLLLFPKSNNPNEDLGQFKKMLQTFRFLD